MPKNKITDLRDHLFMQMENLKDIDLSKPENHAMLQLEVERARAMTNISNSILESAKIEVAFLKHTEGMKSEFLENDKNRLPAKTDHPVEIGSGKPDEGPR